MAFANGKRKLPKEERNAYFIDKILAKATHDVKLIDGVWHRRIKNGRGKWWPVVWSEREYEDNDYQESA